MIKIDTVNLHAKQQIRVVFAVHRNKAVFPLQCSDTPRKPILHIPEDTSAKVNCIMHINKKKLQKKKKLRPAQN
jgi:hypothetical protein